MSNPFFSFTNRAIPGTKVRAEYFNARMDEVVLGFDGVNASIAARAPLASPAFTGTPTAPTAPVGTNTTQIATTAFVQAAIAATTMVSSFNSRSGAVTLLSSDVTGALGYTPANKAGDTFTGKLTTAASSGSSSGLNIPHGADPTSPVNGDMWTTTSGIFVRINGITRQLAYTSSSGTVTSFNSRTGDITLLSSDVTGALGYTPANKAGDTFTGKVTTAASASGGAGFNLPHGSAPTSPANGDMWTTTSGVFVRINGATRQLLDSTSSTGVTSFNSRTGAVTLQSSDVTGALGYTPANKAGETFTGKVTTVASASGGAGFNLPHGTAPTSPANGDLWTTTSGIFVRINGVTRQLVDSSSSGVTSFNSRTGAVTLLSSDVTGALGYVPANVAGDTFTGKVTTVAASASAAGFRLPHGSAPSSPADGDVWTTTSGVFARINGATRQMLDSSMNVVNTFNSRTGAVTLLSSDVTGALGYTPANRAGDAFTGSVGFSTAPIAGYSTTFGGGGTLTTVGWSKAAYFGQGEVIVMDTGVAGAGRYVFFGATSDGNLYFGRTQLDNGTTGADYYMRVDTGGRVIVQPYGSGGPALTAWASSGGVGLRVIGDISETARFVSNAASGNNWLSFYRSGESVRKGFIGYASTSNNFFIVNEESGATVELGTAGLTRFYIGPDAVSHFRGGARTEPKSVAYSATPTFDATTSNVFYFGTLTGNVTSVSISGISDGQTIQIRFQQDATGGRTVTLGSIFSVSGSVNTAANAVTWLVVTYTSASGKFEGTWTRVS